MRGIMMNLIMVGDGESDVDDGNNSNDKDHK